MANFHSVTPELAERLKAIVGEKRFQYGDKVKEDYELTVSCIREVE